jgi:transposase
MQDAVGSASAAGHSVLFDVGQAPEATPTPPAGGARPRLRYANREQITMRVCALDDLVPEDHPVRMVWEHVNGLDVSPLLAKIQATEAHAGAPATDPRILMSLWLYATLRGIGSARELNRRCDLQCGEVPFQWLCGEVSVNYHLLADFRTAHGDFLDRVLTQSVAALQHEGLVSLERVAQDGIKVRASAGASSFRRRPTLEEHLHDAEQQVQTLKAELEADPGACNRRQQKARERAARERHERVQQALQHMGDIEARKKPKEKEAHGATSDAEAQVNKPKEKEPRVSTTDAEARVMKMGDGGFRPAFNAQLATDTATQIITGVDVSNSGGDQGKMAPMVHQHEERYAEAPEEFLVDGGFVKKEDIEDVSPPNGGTTVYAPVPKPKDPNRDPHTPRADDAPAVAEWRQRMASAEAKEIYKLRASTAECVNANARNRGLQQFRVRGLVKVRAVLLWYVLAHNLVRAATLRAQRDSKAT